MDIGTFRGITTLLIMIAFLGVVFWAYSKRRKKDFDEASRLPFADDDEDATESRDRSGTQDKTSSRHDEGDKHS
ncbi:cbb3-type cytochrome c oxidase subunit 3 [Halomonas sp. McH1-25]|uniref:cbb3-type cytochrome oxidase subunit 3 n=1 Tax=unclassified Halomonas TaxID=2609666 RepID=UPI001EF4B183|nr:MULTISPECIES: cbb3-type cytochrome c oxidase subunit 3 [unclassified Halomonas]MCG7600700.1 cbb3-type cytochrome c oxidase subunit 3 [Halomonas sp. McH1-25]MCP1341278.1 cbb3-type cytochrome c oxidase subunit 3 [Halomonas sp. FL8]MCP1361829.1 cbb3-type cytochrome c oxidase subunit 3 [Halomonas sp. BBD45]